MDTEHPKVLATVSVTLLPRLTFTFRWKKGKSDFGIAYRMQFILIQSLLRFRLLWALPGRMMSFLLRRPTDWLPHSLEPWKAHKQAVQNWKPQSALLHTPSPFTEWHLAGCWHRGQGLRHSSLKRVLATWKESKEFLTTLKMSWPKNKNTVMAFLFSFL